MNIFKKIKMKFKRSEFKYIKDTPDFTHLDNREIYKAMYNEVGTVKANKSVVWREEWMKYFKPSPNSTILELGAHNGPNLIHYARLKHHIDGVEISDTLIETYNKHAGQEKKDVQAKMRMFQGWIEDFQSDRKYDYVLLTEILEHVKDPIAIIKKVAECLQDDGAIYISSPSTHWGNNTHVRGVPVKYLTKLLNEANLEIDKIFAEDGRTFCWASKKT